MQIDNPSVNHNLTRSSCALGVSSVNTGFTLICFAGKVQHHNVNYILQATAGMDSWKIRCIVEDAADYGIPDELGSQLTHCFE
jgi:hypothetical protein